MTDQPEKYVSIDEQGYPVFDELRVTDIEVGAQLLRRLERQPNGTFVTHLDDETYLVENFDAPLVIQSVEKPVGDHFLAHFPYDLTEKILLSSLSIDEWDRFHGRTNKDIPVVFSRKAQAIFFDLLDEYDDDSITVDGKNIALPPWLTANGPLDHSEFWTDLYKKGETKWELDEPAAALVDMFPRMKMPRSRILVLGAGSGNDAAFFARSGHIVTAVDISDEALTRAKKKYGDLSNITWIKADLFSLPRQFSEGFDLIFEHTCYCAIDPARRNELVKVWNRCLAPRGYLMGIFFVHDYMNGPPTGGSEWEIRERLRKSYDFRFWGRWRQSVPRRQGFELFVYAQRK